MNPNCQKYKTTEQIRITIIDLLASGNNERQIAKKLSCSFQSINWHTRKMMQEWNCRTRTQLVVKLKLLQVAQTRSDGITISQETLDKIISS